MSGLGLRIGLCVRFRVMNDVLKLGLGLCVTGMVRVRVRWRRGGEAHQGPVRVRVRVGVMCQVEGCGLCISVGVMRHV